MKIFKPLQASLLHKTFLLKGKHRLSMGVLLAFPFDGGEPLLEPDMWKLITAEIGKDGFLDLGMPKPNGEVLVYGSYFSPNKAPVTVDSVRLKIGKIDKSLLIYGNRYWRTLLGASEPEQFRTMPLDYMHAFGGEGFAKNPRGKGMVEVDVYGESRRPLPNIEHPDDVMSSPGQRPDPAGFGPLDMAWDFRASKLGTYDDKWLKEHWPAYPMDLNWNHFNAAPKDQWIDEFFSCNEEFELYNMHPEKSIVNGQLPSYRTRCFINRSSSKEGEIDEVKMRAETVWLFPHQEIGIVLYRGVIDITTDDASDVQNVIIGYENLSDPMRESAHYSEALISRQAGLRTMNTTDLIPMGAICGFGAVTEDGPDNEDAYGMENEIEEETAILDEPPFFPRPLGYEVIANLISERQRAQQLREKVVSAGGNASTVPLPSTDIETVRINLENAEIELKDSYRAQAHLLEEGRPVHENDLDTLQLELFERLKNKESVAGWDFAGLDLSNQDLSGVDFTGCYLEKVKLTDSKLVGAKLEGAILTFADLTRCDLTGANLKRSNLGTANLTEAIFNGADLSEAILAKSVLWRASLVDCNLSEADFFETQFENADLSGSTLPHMQFIDLYMAGVKFRKSQLTGCTFINCNLEKCDFTEAILDETTWIDSWLDGANFDQAHMTNNRFPGGSSLRGAFFGKTILDNSNLRDTNICDADFTEASLNMCDFSDTNAQKARFTKAVAKYARFIGANLGEADLTNLNLMEGSLMKARLTSAVLRRANCYGVEFMQATVGETDFGSAILDMTKLAKWRPS